MSRRSYYHQESAKVRSLIRTSRARSSTRLTRRTTGASTQRCSTRAEGRRIADAKPLVFSKRPNKELNRPKRGTRSTKTGKHQGNRPTAPPYCFGGLRVT